MKTPVNPTRMFLNSGGEESGVPGEKGPGLKSNAGPSHCEATVLMIFEKQGITQQLKSHE